MDADEIVEPEDDEENTDDPRSRTPCGVYPRFAFGSSGSVEIRVDLALEFIGQFYDLRSQECLPCKRREQYRERRKILGESFRAKLGREQYRDKSEKERGSFRQFASTRDEQDIADQHRQHSDGEVHQQFHPRVRIPLAADRDREVGTDLEFCCKMLEEKPKVLRKIRIDNVAGDHPAGRICKRSPLETSFVPGDDRCPDYRRKPQQRKQAVCPHKREHQRQQPDVLSLEKQVNTEHRDDDRQRWGFTHVHAIVERI